MQVDGSGTGFGEELDCSVEVVISGIGPQCQRDAVGCCSADQRRTTDLHGFDRVGDCVDIRQALINYLTRKPGLVEDDDGVAILGKRMKRIAQFSFPWQCLYFLPLPQGQGSLRPILSTTRSIGLAGASSAAVAPSASS